MNDITILHISDLHINSVYNSCSYSLNKMLEDIRLQCKSLNNIIVIVTGDIVHRGNYKCKAAIIDFFSKLKSILGSKFLKIYIVPGNHDKVRSREDKILVENFSSKDSNYYKNGWNYNKISFIEYSSLQYEIYNIFEHSLDENRKRVINDTFGIEVLEVEKKKYVFIQFNSAWSCLGEEDKRNLSIGDFQLKEILENYKKEWSELSNTPGEVTLTFVLSHHPLTWLKAEEEDNVRNNLLSVDSLNADVYICGHTHNRDVLNWYNNRRTLTTLTTGFGWPDNEIIEGIQNHCYSIYLFHTELNALEIYMRSNDEEMNFVSDLKIYTNQRDRKQNCIIFPIKSFKNQPYINLHSARNRRQKVCYLTDNLVNSIRDVSYVLTELTRRSEEIVFSSAFRVTETVQKISIEQSSNKDLNCFIQLLWKYKKNDNEKQQYLYLFDKFQDNLTNTIYNSLNLLFQQICFIFAEIMKPTAEERNELIRIHFRYYNEIEDSYVKLYACDRNGNSTSLSDIVWGGLIEESFFVQNSLINSINEDLSHVAMKSHWKNFITVIPSFSKNRTCIMKGKNEEWRPLITFGISIGNYALDDFLYLFDFLSIDRIIGEIIEDFLSRFPIDLYNYFVFLSMK